VKSIKTGQRYSDDSFGTSCHLANKNKNDNTVFYENYTDNIKL